MKITKAVITAAARGSRLYPAADTLQKAMLPLSDRNGLSRPLIQIIAEEALAAGIEQICIICAPGDQKGFVNQFKTIRKNLTETYKGEDWARGEVDNIDNLLDRLSFEVQEEPLGYGHAVHCSGAFVADEPFILLLSDHLYVSRDPEVSCARQVICLAETEDAPVSSVNPVREHLIRKYGTLTGRRLPRRNGVYQIEKILEKPSISRAELELHTPGLRTGQYLCFFGMHVLTPRIFELLQENFQQESNPDRYGLTPALNALAESQTYLALEVKGARYDISSKLGLLRAQIALGLSGRDRDAVMSAITEMLVEEGQNLTPGRGV